MIGRGWGGTLSAQRPGGYPPPLSHCPLFAEKSGSFKVSKIICAWTPGHPWDTGYSHAETWSQKSASIRDTARRRINSGENPQKAALRIEIRWATEPTSSAKFAVHGQTRGAARMNAAAFRYASFQCFSFSVAKEPLPQAGGPWGHSFHVLSVTYRKRKFKMVLSKCCQKCGQPGYQQVIRISSTRSRTSLTAQRNML